MPGIVGMIRLDGQPACIDAALAKLHHLPTYQSIKMQLTPAVSLGAIHRGESARECDWHYHAERQVGIVIIGIMICPAPHPHIMSAQEVFDEYQTYGFKHWHQFDGSFIAVIVDLPRGRMFIANDRLGILPLYYAQRPNFFAFAPEAKGVLVHNGMSPRLSPAGMVNFLTAGYCFGEHTLFEEVCLLEPSTLLSIHLPTLTIDKSRLWKIVYEPARDLNGRRAAEEALAQAIIAAHKITLCDTPSNLGVWLSGGWDSRGILAALTQLNYQAQKALSWGVRDDIPGSDVVLARRMAEEFNVPFVYTTYDSDAVAENADFWCYLSELTTDNFGWFVETPRIFSNNSHATPEVILVGDEAWGWRGYVANETEARACVFPAKLPSALCTILQPSFTNTAEGMYDDAIQGVSQACENTDFVDRKDFLYLHGRVARFIFPLRSFKEFTAPLRRPFLSNHVLEIIRRLPTQHRLYKNLYISTLYNHFPRATSVPVVRANSLPDWAFDIRRKQALRELFLRLLDFRHIEQGGLSQLLNREAFERLRDNSFNSNVQPLSRYDSWARLFKRKVERAVSRSRWATSMMHTLHNTAEVRPPSVFDILRRVALLVLLQENLNDLVRPNSAHVVQPRVVVDRTALS